MLVAIRAGYRALARGIQPEMELPFQADECDYAELDHLFQLYSDGKFEELRTRIETSTSSRTTKVLFTALIVTTHNQKSYKDAVERDLQDAEVLYNLYQHAKELDALKAKAPAVAGTVKLVSVPNSPSGELKEPDTDDSGSSTSGGDLIHYCGNSPCSFCDPDYDLPEAQ